MTKYAIVPVEPTDEMLYSLSLHSSMPTGYDAMLAARPPLDAEMLAAVELARKTLATRSARGKVLLLLYAELGIKHSESAPHKTEEEIIARALLRAAGQEDGQ